MFYTNNDANSSEFEITADIMQLYPSYNVTKCTKKDVYSDSVYKPESKLISTLLANISI